LTTRVTQTLDGQLSANETLAYVDDDLLLSSSLHEVVLWNPSARHTGQLLHHNADRMGSLAVSADGEQLAMGGWDRSIYIYDFAKKAVIQHLVGVDLIFRKLAFSQDEHYLAAASPREYVVWDLTTGKPMTPIFERNEGILGLQFEDADTLRVNFYQGSEYLNIHQVDSVTAEPGHLKIAERRYTATPDGYLDELGHLVPPGEFAYNASRDLYASYTTNDANVHLWDPSEQRIIATLQGHVAKVLTANFSADGNLLATGSQDGSIILWDVATAQPLGQALHGHSREVEHLMFHPNNPWLLSTSRDGNTILWNVDPSSWQRELCQKSGRAFTVEEAERYLAGAEIKLPCFD
jgi:WD40 repeat protein